MPAQSWSEISSGIYGNPELSKKLRMISRKQTKMYDVVDKATEFNLGKKSGDKVGCRLVGRITTLADSALGEFQKIPFGRAPEYTKQITVYRRGFATVWTGSRADLDRVDVENKTVEALRDQAARTLNKVVYTAMLAGYSHWYVALTASTYGSDTDGSLSGTAATPFGQFHLRKLKLIAMQKAIPPMDGNNWWFIGSPRIADDMLGDAATGSGSFVDVAKYDPSRVAGILAGEIGKIGNVRIAIDNDILTDTINTSYGQGFFCGQETCKEVLVYPMHLRYNGNLGGEFGNQAAIAWQSMSGYDTLWNYGLHGQANYIRYA